MPPYSTINKHIGSIHFVKISNIISAKCQFALQMKARRRYWKEFVLNNERRTLTINLGYDNKSMGVDFELLDVR
jgi:hypothetical protein